MLLMNCFGSVASLDDALWSAEDSGDDGVWREEADALCLLLHLPTVRSVVSWIGGMPSTLTNFIGNMKRTDIERLSKRAGTWDQGSPFSLIRLPSSYNQLFEAAAFAKCPRKGKSPTYSAICLLCGRYVCMQCCEGPGQLTKHAAECSN